MFRTLQHMSNNDLLIVLFSCSEFFAHKKTKNQKTKIHINNQTIRTIGRATHIISSNQFR